MLVSSSQSQHGILDSQEVRSCLSFSSWAPEDLPGPSFVLQSLLILLDLHMLGCISSSQLTVSCCLPKSFLPMPFNQFLCLHLGSSSSSFELSIFLRISVFITDLPSALCFPNFNFITFQHCKLLPACHLPFGLLTVWSLLSKVLSFKSNSFIHYILEYSDSS